MRVLHATVLLGGLLTLAACGSLPTPPSEAAATPTLAAGGAGALQAQATAGTLTVGQKLQLNVTVGGRPPQPGELTWTTSSARVATVSPSGLVTATGSGNAVIRVALTQNPGVFLNFSLAVTAPAPAPAPVPAPAPGTSPSAFAQQVLTLTNQARAQARSCGAASFAAAAPLTFSAQLAQAAQGHASDMAARNYFSHTSLDGRTVAQRVTAAGYSWRALGENIAAGQRTPEEVVAGWLRSEGHCRNIMNPSYRELGVGYAQGSSYGTYWVQDFGTR